MGYSIAIGEVEIGELLCEDGQYHVPLYVTPATTADAPVDDSPTSGTNSRWPSYNGWSNFCKSTGLTSVFFDDNMGLMKAHPGVAELTDLHLATVKSACAHLKKNQPAVYEEQRDRILWLEYWMEWALKNCVRPAVRNS